MYTVETDCSLALGGLGGQSAYPETDAGDGNTADMLALGGMETWTSNREKGLR